MMTVTVSDVSGVTWQELSIVAGGIVFAGVLVAGAVCWLWSKFNEQSIEISSLKLTIAEKYVTHESFSKGEERLIKAIDEMKDEFRGMTNRLDRYFERAATGSYPAVGSTGTGHYKS